MPRVSPQFLQSVAGELSRLAIDPRDLEAVAVQLGAQLDGLARLDELDLSQVEPAVVLVAQLEARP